MAAQRDTVGLAPAGRLKDIGFDENPIDRPTTLARAGIEKNLGDGRGSVRQGCYAEREEYGRTCSLSDSEVVNR